jgi:hypothetical protein
MAPTMIKPPPDLKQNGVLVDKFCDAVFNCNIEHIPGIVKELIQTGAWRKRWCALMIYENESFKEFITEPPRKGCGWQPEKVEALLKFDPDVLALWRQELAAGEAREEDREYEAARLKRPHGTNRYTVDLDNEKRGIKLYPDGTSEHYALRRLRKDRPDVHARVLAGEISAHAGMVEAGFRRPRPSRRKTSLQKVLALLPDLTWPERAEVRSALHKLDKERPEGAAA